MAKKMIIKGVGQFLAKRYSADGKGVEVVRLGTLQNLRFDFNVEIEDIFGGDGLFAIDTLVRQKAVDISATDAKFDLSQLQLMMGSSLKEQETTSLWVMGEQNTAYDGYLDPATTTTPVAEVEVEFGASLFGDGNFSVVLKDSNKALTRVPYDNTTPPTANQFMVHTYDDSGETKTRLVFNASISGSDVEYSYQRVETGVDVVDLLVDEVPFPVHIVHHGSFLQKDGTYRGIETELFMCIANGQFSIDSQRATATASTVSLRVLDPERADGKLGSVKLYSSQKRV